MFAHPLHGEGVWKPTGPAINGKPPVLVTTFRTERDYPRIVAYVAWFDHTRTAIAYYPGRYEPPSATPARADARYRTVSGGDCSRRSTAASSTGTD